ncbi:hypothetical protein PLCT1_02102 [Planctomycetaceae bacterium]|nr:hypothetical protein PLCT1_02102 [Planctomycetaceae bacterium]
MLVLSAMLLCGCAESDPYRRFEPGATLDVSTARLTDAYNQRWPMQFKTVQTVTIDFGPVTRTFNALLIIQQPGKFRLQGMTEQGIKVFEIVHSDGRDSVIFKADEMSEKTSASISRDIQRVFLNRLVGKAESSRGSKYHMLETNTVESTQRVMLFGGRGSTWQDEWHVTEKRDAWVDRMEQSDRDGRSFCYACFEWREPRNQQEALQGLFYPSVIVLHDSGRESKSYPYKLTIKITELTVRETPWPERTFKP